MASALRPPPARVSPPDPGRGTGACLSVTEMQAQLAELEYMPGWTLELVAGTLATEGTQLRVRATVPNSYRPAETVDLDIWTYVPPMADGAAFCTWLAWRLARIAIHESAEWLRRNGRPVFDPHAS